MIRFRNPSSSLETMLASFEQLHDELADKEYFNNDDIAAVLAKSNLMASSGFTGDAAIALGANSNRSRDKTYNNAKMFAEIYRLLGLISVVNNVSSQYRFTFIGDHMVVPNADRKAIIEQCIIGMNNPNKIMDVSYTESIRFFSCVLFTMQDLDGYLSRDEMILGPMCINDNDETEYNNMILHIKELRASRSLSRVNHELEALGKTLTDNKSTGMSVDSMQNCTRIPISVLKYCGWVEDEYKRFYDRSVKFMKLTEHGKSTIAKIRVMRDLRLDDYEKSSAKQQEALIRLGAYQMLLRSNFDLSEVEDDIEKDKKVCEKILGGQEILFSPYQTLEYDVVNHALNIELTARGNAKNNSIIAEYESNLKEIIKTIQANQGITLSEGIYFNEELSTDGTREYITHVGQLYAQNANFDLIVNQIVEEHVKDRKTEYYPFVETLFRVIGLDCHKSRDGVIGERWDAMIRDENNSIPIEIKSPTEEEHISIKAIRQALENKIVLLSRKTYKTTESCASFAVGYFAPNDRAEVIDLIADIKATFGYKIAVFDLPTLVVLSLNTLFLGRGIDLCKLAELEGIINVKDI